MKSLAHPCGKRGFKAPYLHVYQTEDPVKEGAFHAVNLRLSSGEQIPLSGHSATSRRKLADCRRESWEQAAQVLDELARQARLQADFYAAATDEPLPAKPATTDSPEVREFRGTFTHCVSPTGLVYVAKKPQA